MLANTRNRNPCQALSSRLEKHVRIAGTPFLCYKELEIYKDPNDDGVVKSLIYGVVAIFHALDIP